MSKDRELERIKERKLREMLRKAGEKARGVVIDKPIPVDEEQFEEIIRKHELVFVDFWAAWCGPCRMIAPIIEELAREYAGKVVFVKVDVDRNRRLAMKFGIMSIPTLILFKNGKPVDMVIGVYPKPALEQIINQYL